MIETEEWKSLEGFSGYLFSNMGQIIRLRDSKIEPTTLSGIPKYKYVHLVPDGGKRGLYRLHRLIAQAWIPNPDNYKMVDHINRDKLDNRVENLRWTCGSGNKKNTDTAFFAIYKGFWVHVKTFYKDDISAYGYAYQNKHLSNDLEEIERIRNASNHTKKVMWEGEEKLLKDVCDEYGKDYAAVLQKLHTSNSTVYACVFYDKIPYVSFELEGIGGVKYQFSSQQELADYLEVSIERVKDFITECDNSINKLRFLCSSWKPKDNRTLYTIGGVSKYREEWISFYETSEERVSAKMSKHKLTFEEAVQLPIERIRKVSVNGDVMYVKDMWEMFGLDAKKANNYRSEGKTTFKETLIKFGVDVEGLTITPM